jgi:hypothetical protein
MGGNPIELTAAEAAEMVALSLRPAAEMLNGSKL